jgi:hypothetical protein
MPVFVRIFFKQFLLIYTAYCTTTVHHEVRLFTPMFGPYFDRSFCRACHPGVWLTHFASAGRNPSTPSRRTGRGWPRDAAAISRQLFCRPFPDLKSWTSLSGLRSQFLRRRTIRNVVGTQLSAHQPISGVFRRSIFDFLAAMGWRVATERLLAWSGVCDACVLPASMAARAQRIQLPLLLIQPELGCTNPLRNAVFWMGLAPSPFLLVNHASARSIGRSDETSTKYSAA